MQASTDITPAADPGRTPATDPPADRLVAVAAGEHTCWHYCSGDFVLGINRETVEKLHTPHASDGRRVQRHDPTVDDKR